MLNALHFRLDRSLLQEQFPGTEIKIVYVCPSSLNGSFVPDNFTLRVRKLHQSGAASIDDKIS
ncbi:hypothetical protein ACHAQD_011401 [Fusarium lateritium]